jgi:hypothetical protein
MSRTAAAGAFVLVVAGLSGCASPARVIRQDAASVVVAIPDNTNTWPFYYRDAADQAAAAHIHDPVVTRLERVKVGEETAAPSDMAQREPGAHRSFGDVITSTNTVTLSDRYEYHFEYRSNGPTRGAGPVGGSGPPVPGAPAASLAPQGPVNAVAAPKPPVIPPILPADAPAASLPSTVQPGR